MNKFNKRHRLWLAALVVTGIAAVWLVTKPTPPPLNQSNVSISDFISATDRGFARADRPWQFDFPADHGPHPTYRTESWYFVGTLATPQGRQFGFQLTFFRVGLAPQVAHSASAWATNQIYRSHFAVTDVAKKAFYAAERYSRAALGLSGATLAPVQVWVENWRAALVADSGQAANFHLLASDQDTEIDIRLHSSKPPLLPQAGNLFATGANPRNAFHYYAVPRLAAQGKISIGSEVFQVSGEAWLDRAWGAVPISRGQLAINRFLLQLDDGREILGLQLHRRDGSGTPITTGLLINQDASGQVLERRAMVLEELDYWTSPGDDTRYPSRWRLAIPEQAIELTITPAVSNQEMTMALRYWAGSVTVSGTAHGRSIGGNGHVELTGYADNPDSSR